MNKIRVAVGLSGGVDSAVSAYLLKKQGFDVSGVYLHCFDDDAPGCRGKQDRQDALSVALHLKIPFQVLDFSKQYKSAVIGYFKKEYLAGRTPNPDVVCNRDIKFGLFLDWAIKAGFDYIATGHYAKLVSTKTIEDRAWKVGVEDRRLKIDKSDLSSTIHPLPPSSIFHHLSSKKSSNVFLARPADKHKDQTYFLWAVPRQKFSRVLFPLADFRKQDVRSVAKFAKIPVADKPDSTGICFIGEVRVGDFLKRLGVKEKTGEVVIKNKDYNNYNGYKGYSYQIVGRHRGVWFYTIGQRHGFEITRWPVIGSQLPASPELQRGESVVSSESAGFQSAGSKPINRKPTNHKQKTENRKQITDKPPLYVIEKDVKYNRLVVGFGPECYRDQFEVGDCNWLASGKVRPWRTPRSDLNRLTHQRINASTHCLVRIRHGGDLIPCSVIGSRSSVFGSESAGFQSACSRLANRQPTNQNLKTENRELTTVFLAAPQRGVAPGQSAVFYSKDGTVLGGGVIQ